MQIAYELAGGIPVAFDAAAAYAKTVSERPDVRKFRTELAGRIPEMFDRLLQYGGKARGVALTRAVGRRHLRIDSESDRRLLRGHPFRDVILKGGQGDNGPELCTTLLGVQAVRRMGKYDGGAAIEAQELYRLRRYGACVEALRNGGEGERPLLMAAATMMNEVYGDDPGNLYFEVNVKWKKVRDAADSAARMCKSRESEREFLNWRGIAEAHFGRDSGFVGDGKAEHGIVYLAIRALASERDQNSVSGAYTALPIVEEALRMYVAGALGIEARGEAFEEVTDSDLNRWWKAGGDFERPGKEDRLKAAELAVLTAAMSERAGRGVFQGPQELSRLLSVLDLSRNKLAHYATTPSKSVKGRLVEWSRRIIDATAEQKGVDVRVRDVERWVEPPTEFLDWFAGVPEATRFDRY